MVMKTVHKRCKYSPTCCFFKWSCRTLTLPNVPKCSSRTNVTDTLFITGNNGRSRVDGSTPVHHHGYTTNLIYFTFFIFNFLCCAASHPTLCKLLRVLYYFLVNILAPIHQVKFLVCVICLLRTKCTIMLSNTVCSFPG